MSKTPRPISPVSRLPNLARSQKVEELVKEYVRHNADAVTEIQELLADARLSLEALTADELADRPKYLDYIERIDRLASIAESRRNASLREIERRRAVLGGALRQGVQDVEDAEFKMIERRQLKGKDAASRATARSGLTARMHAPAPARRPRRAALGRRETLFATV